MLATVKSELLGDNRVQEITSTVKGIELRYAGELWGYTGPVVVSLVRKGDELQEDFSILNGFFEFSGVATKGELPSVASCRDRARASVAYT